MLNQRFGRYVFRTLEELDDHKHSSRVFTQMSNFTRPGEVLFVKGHSLQLHVLAPGCDLIETGCVPDGKIAVFLNTGAQHCIFRDRVVAENHLTSFQGRDNFVAIHTGEYRSYLLLFDLNRVETLLEHRDYGNFISCINISQSASIYAPELIQLVNALVSNLKREADDLASFSNRDSVKLEVEWLKEWSSVATGADRHSPLRANRRVRIVNAAVEYLTQCDLQRTSSRDIASAINISQRSLNAAFKGTLGETLASYIRKFRLNFARKALLEKTDFTSVEQCASHYGYKHVGKFIQQYKKLFSETPGNTLRKQRIEPLGAGTFSRIELQPIPSDDERHQDSEKF